MRIFSAWKRGTKKESNEVLNYRWFLKIHKSYRDRCFDVTLFTCPNFKQWYKNNESQREWKINSASSMKCLIFSSLILVSRNSSSFYLCVNRDPNIFLAKPSNTAEIEQKVFKCYNPRILFGMQTVSMQNFGIPQNVIYKQLFLSSKINMNMWSHSFVMYYLCFNIQPSIPLIIPYLDPSESFHFIWYVTMKNASFCTLFGWNAINRVHL